MKVLVVGLPLFAKRLSGELASFDHKNTYIWLDTYYNKLDKIKAWFLIPSSDLIFSINGTLTTSGVFDRAFKFNKPVIMHWAGTDILKSTKAFHSGNYRKDYLEKSFHHCSSPWMQQELLEIGIRSEIIHFNNYDSIFEFEPCRSDRLTVLTYVSEIRSEFYGMSTILKMARQFHDVHFIIVGTKGKDYEPLPSNVEALGWVDDMNNEFKRAHVCLRYTDHDGLSNFILESLARQKTVLYRNPLESCIHTKDEKDLHNALDVLKKRFKSGDDFRNESGAHYIQNELNREKVLSNLVAKFSKVLS